MPKRLFIIDDEEDILEILNIVFEDEGYEVITANNSDAAERILSCRPDLVLLDVRILGSAKSGTQICSELKAEPKTRHIPVLLLSAEYDLKQLAVSCHADGYIGKPFDLSELLDIIARYL